MTQLELDRFHQFAARKMANGGARLSLEDCLALWREEQGAEEDLASIRRGLADADAGRVHSIEEVESSICEKLGFARRRA